MHGLAHTTRIAYGECTISMEEQQHIGISTSSMSTIVELLSTSTNGAAYYLKCLFVCACVCVRRGSGDHKRLGTNHDTLLCNTQRIIVCAALHMPYLGTSTFSKCACAVSAATISNDNLHNSVITTFPSTASGSGVDILAMCCCEIGRNVILPLYGLLDVLCFVL